MKTNVDVANNGIEVIENRELTDSVVEIVVPEQLVEDLDLSQHTDGSWPSSKNVSQ